MDISFFPPLGTVKENCPHVPLYQMTIEEFLQGIISGKWAEQVNKIRSEPNKKKRDALKRKYLHGVTISGTFDHRHSDKLLKHSGFISIDIDPKENPLGWDLAELAADPYTYACFISASGLGVVIIVKINGAKHPQCFKWLQRYYADKFQLVIDTAPQNVNAIRFVSVDPDCHINTDAKEAPALEEEKRAPEFTPSGTLTDNLQIISKLAKEAIAQNIDITAATPEESSYKRWVKIGLILKDSFNETDALALFQLISCKHPSYTEEETKKKFKALLKKRSKPTEASSLATLFEIYKKAGFTYADKNNTKKEKSKPTTYAGAGAIATPVSVTTKTPKNKKTTVQQKVMKLEAWIKQFNIRRNSVTGNLELKGEAIPEERLLAMYMQALKDVNEWFTLAFFEQSILSSNNTAYYNPFLEYAEANKHRSSVGNIDKVCQCLNTNTAYYTIYVRKWLLSIMAAIHGEAVRYVLTLTGPQFIGKTSFFENLLPKELQSYFTISDLDRGKDDELLMCQKLIICIDELNSNLYNNDKKFKTITSKAKFSLRPPYGKVNKDFKRLAVLCATANEEEVLTDITGNTRILPIAVESVNFDLLNSIDRAELFMELYRAYKNGAEWNLTKEEMEFLAISSADFKIVSVEREMLAKYFKKPQTDAGEWMTNTDVCIYIREKSNQLNLRLNPNKIGAELKNMVGPSQSRWLNGTTLKMYFVEKVGFIEKMAYSYKDITA